MKFRYVLRSSLLSIAALSISIQMHAAHLNAPRWDVSIVDQQGKPIAGVSVTEVYQDYSCESDSNTVTQITDITGQVHFSPKYLRRNPIKCSKETASNLGSGVHASLGRYAYLILRARNLKEYVEDSKTSTPTWSGKSDQMVSRFVMRPMNERELKVQSWQDSFRKQSGDKSVN